MAERRRLLLISLSAVVCIRVLILVRLIGECEVKY
jgi:hypothetical protein